LLPWLSARQLLDWQQFAAEHGLGVRRDDIHFGMLISLLYNVHRGKNDPAKSPKDFMPYLRHDPLEEDISQEEFVGNLSHLLAGIRGKPTTYS
jgi:hypothetical protein